MRITIKATLRKDEGKQLSFVGTALKDAGAIIPVTGAGGPFGNVLRPLTSGHYSPVSLYLSASILLVFVIAAVLKTAQGSSTVAIITTPAIIAPLLIQLGLDSETGRALAVLGDRSW